MVSPDSRRGVLRLALTVSGLLLFGIFAYTTESSWSYLNAVLLPTRTHVPHVPSIPTIPTTGGHPPFESVGIVTYIPDGHIKFINQAHHMLWSSWRYATSHVDRASRGRTDLILFAHRNVISQMPDECTLLDVTDAAAVEATRTHVADQCYVVERTPPADDYWFRYSFMFSLSYLAEPAFHTLLMDYDRLLRSDSDVVITPAFLSFRPPQFVVGRGGYMDEDFTRHRIHKLALDLNMTHQGLYNVGSTWFGNSSLVLTMTPKMLQVAQFILDSPIYGEEMGFPKWHPGVTSMYAGELVVNHFIPKDNVWVNSESLDINCNGHERTADVYHSHCWPGDQYPGYFNKWAYERGEYTVDKFPRQTLNISVINDYFMAMVLYGA